MPSNASSAIAKSKRFSFYLSRLLAARPEEEQRLEQQLGTPFTPEQMASFAPWSTLTTPESLSPVLRALRRAVMARMITRDIAQRADLPEVLATITGLAEFAVRTALPVASAPLAHYGNPIGEDSA